MHVTHSLSLSRPISPSFPNACSLPQHNTHLPPSLFLSRFLPTLPYLTYAVHTAWYGAPFARVYLLSVFFTLSPHLPLPTSCPTHTRISLTRRSHTTHSLPLQPGLASYPDLSFNFFPPFPFFGPDVLAGPLP